MASNLRNNTVAVATLGTSLKGHIVTTREQMNELFHRYAIPYRDDGSVMLPIWVKSLAINVPATVFHEACAWCLAAPSEAEVLERAAAVLVTSDFAGGEGVNTWEDWASESLERPDPVFRRQQAIRELIGWVEK